MLIHSFYYRTFLAIVLLSFVAGPPAGGQEQKPATPTTQGLEFEPSSNGTKLARAKESFSTLSLKGSDLVPRPPLSGGPERTPDYTRELVRLQWRPNDPIDTFVILPPDVKNPPVVLYLYGFPSEFERFYDKRYCGRLVKSGAAAVCFLSAYTGYRAEHGSPKEWFVSALPESLAVTVHDVQLILDYLATRGDLDMSRVGMFGQGSGGAIAMLAAATDPRIKALDLLNPWGDWPDWLAKSHVVPKEERDTYLKPDFLKRVEPLEPIRYLPQLASSPIRIQFFDDENAPTKEAMDKIEAAAPPTAKIVHYPNGHAEYKVSSDGRLFAWLATQLKSLNTKEPAAKAPAAAAAQ